jgi:hypothetical protein
VESGPDGINKVVDKFILKNTFISKRQVELKIWDLAVKEKRGSDAKQVALLQLFIKYECIF